MTEQEALPTWPELWSWCVKQAERGGCAAEFVLYETMRKRAPRSEPEGLDALSELRTVRSELRTVKIQLEDSLHLINQALAVRVSERAK